MEEAIAAAQRRRAAPGGPKHVGTEEVPHAVPYADTMWALAHQNGDKLPDLVRANPQVRHPGHIHPNDILFVPTHDPATVATRRQIADAVASDRSAAAIESSLHHPKLPPGVRKVLVQDLADARADASRKWAAVKTSVLDELIRDGAGTMASDAEMHARVIEIRARAPESEAFQKIVDAAAAQAPIDGKVRAIIARAQGQHDAPAALRTLSDGYAAATPAVKDTLLRDGGAQKFIDAAAAWANEPLHQPVDGITNPQARTAEAIQRLDQATQGVDKNLAGMVMDRAVSGYERFRDDNLNHLPGSSPFGANGTTTLVNLSGRLAGSPAADDAIARFAALDAWNGDSIRNAIAAGADPAYAIALAQHIKSFGDPSIVVHTINDGIALRDQQRIADGGSPAATIDVARRMHAAGLDERGVMKVATDGMQAYKDKVAGDVRKLGEHDAELVALVRNEGTGMTPQQLAQTIAAYRTDKGAAWQTEGAGLVRQIAADGSRLLDQMVALNEMPPQLAGSQALTDRALKTIANDPAAGVALSVAIATDPRLADAQHVKDFADIFALSKVGDIGRKYTTEIASSRLRRRVNASVLGVDLQDPASVARAKQAIRAIADEASMRRVGVTKGDLDKAVKLVDATVDRVAGARTSDEIDMALRDLDKKLNTDAALSKTFNKSTRPGQMLRGLAVAFAGASLVNSWSKFSANPSDPQNDIKLLLDAAGFAQKDAELLVGLGMVSKQSAIGQFGGEWKLAGRAGAADLLSGLSAVLDLVSATRSGFGLGVPQDGGSAFFSATSAVGGGLTVAPAFGASVSLGVVGLVVTFVGVLGKSVYDSEKDAHRYEAAAKDFLKAAGYSEAAADALSQRDGLLSGAPGAAQMPFLAKYAGFKHMTTDQLRNWVNSLTPDQVKHLSQRLLETAGDCEGDPGRFTDGPPRTALIPNEGYPVEITLADSVGVFEGYLNHDHVPHP
jgi:hypothetical protein